MEKQHIFAHSYKLFLTVILLLCHNSFCSDIIFRAPYFHHMDTNVSWFGPVAMTLIPTKRIDVYWNISLSIEKCCPGLVVYSSSTESEVGHVEKECMDVEHDYLEFLYDEDYTFVKFDYHRSYGENWCSAPDTDGMYTCAGRTRIRSQTAIVGAAYFFYPCGIKNELKMTYYVDMIEDNRIYECFDVNPLSACRKYYPSGYVPNLMGGTDKDSYLALSFLIQGFLGQCHKHIEEIMCRMWIPECATEDLYISPCQSLVKEIFQYACKDEIKTFFSHYISKPVNFEILTDYYVKSFPTVEPCFNVTVTCDSPLIIEHGSYAIEGGSLYSYPVHTSVAYSCDPDYELVGESTVLCSYSGKWSLVPSCILRSEDKTKEIAIGSLFSFFALSMVVAAVVIIQYRQEIAVILYAKYGFRLRKFREENRKYDAFIAYNLEDISFVKNELLVKLESADPPYNLCVHHRNLDFEVGNWIADNITKAVAASKRTIIVLSQNFINSQWCRFEFSQAHLRLMDDQSFKLIIIALEDPKTLTNVPKLIKSYVKTGTYIARGHKLFWEKLFYQMPSGHKMTKSAQTLTDGDRETYPVGHDNIDLEVI